MHTQKLLPLCGLLLASNIAIASKLDLDDVPTPCRPACSSVIRTAKSCDAKHERDSAEIQCICDWDAAKTQIPLCSACITQYQSDKRNNNFTDGDRGDYDDDSDDDDDDNEALDLVYSCSLTTTTYNSAAVTTVTGTSTSTATSNTATTTSSSSTSETNSQGSTGSTSSGSGSSDSVGNSAGAASSATSIPDAAAGISVPGAASMAGVMGLMALAWL
ncbi:hypothetical protein PENCOP_c013G07667 [Penicillium coprophilum]|uniref:Extracellular membrane protein CFEM domain-containing protein n=1 Tax=Penicillium coprophilum TaxID=36646 RepID=A0A1V6UAQ7_9EURO|nr:hypothetical protein PENCOP_c013G07667 [Penicillium coprophilum]